MTARETEDQDYQELIRKIESGTNFEKLPKEDPHRSHASGSSLRILNTTGGNLVYTGNILVPPYQKKKT